MVTTTTKDDEEVTEATLATMAMTMTIVAKAKTQVGDDIPMTRISPVIYMEGDTVQKSVLYSRSRLANNSRHLAEIDERTSSLVSELVLKIDHGADLESPHLSLH